MSRYILTAVSVLSLVAVLGVVPGHAERKALSKPSERRFDIKPTKWFVGGKLTGGMVVGETADRIADYSDSFSDKLWYGFAMEGERFVTSRLAVGAGIEFGWKIVSGERVNDIRLRSYSGHALYRFSPRARSTVFLRPQIGIIEGTWPRDRGDDRDLGSHTFVALGVGHWLYTGATTVFRLEVQYKHAFSENAELFGVSGVDVQGLGVSLGIFRGF